MVGLGNIDDVYKHYLKVIEENKQLEKKLEIAVKALEEITTDELVKRPRKIRFIVE